MITRFSIPASALLLSGLGVLTACSGSQPSSVHTNAAFQKHSELKAHSGHMDKAQMAQRENDRIRALQQRMLDRGYYSGPVNGIITPETRRAARRFYSDGF